MTLSQVLEKYQVQCPLDIPTLDKAAALPIAAATRVMALRQYINSNLVYYDLKNATFIHQVQTIDGRYIQFEVAVANILSVKCTIF